MATDGLCRPQSWIFYLTYVYLNSSSQKIIKIYILFSIIYLDKLIYLKNMVHEPKIFIKTKLKTISSFIRLKPTLVY